ncbi:MAG: 2-succinyl-5-enolpyruvyl-6-hydroxy-3-cyclohexene-1-carboxylic-acid synthase [Chloroflexota bacterium]|nr:2-succinyl-5-enolpyruvyl-6-hydroxy-3-cyclohexene-1-carboxylic-acid synthase [Chloroflexota bacterium]MDH5243405.1 2-succinyl-5-enolpyruvyl-6-hydroxy-3-cyclohexene-1-carboxylic-acid synthase [Chloroflexota bacterium]
MTAQALSVLVRAFVEELVRAGVREAVICPGSRSTPLALALAAHDGLDTRVLIDERSAGFFALGMARTSERPIVLLATSGTAVVNFAPAVVEASLARVPLVVVTADRPAELRDRGAPQTIDQVRLYGSHVRWSTELPLADDTPETLAHVRSVAGRAVATALGSPAGPVHVNAPFREPLVPTGTLGAWPELPGPDRGDPAGGHAFSEATRGPRRLSRADLARMADRIAATPRGLIVAGPMETSGAAEAIAGLAVATGYPILADPLSGMRTGPHDLSHVLARGDQLARPGPWIDRHLPDLVIRFGAMPTSKPLVELLRHAQPALYVVDGDAGWREATLLPAEFVHADGAATASDLAGALVLRIPPGDDDEIAVQRRKWTGDWLAAEAAADRTMRAWLADLDEPFEGAPFALLPEILSDDAVVWAGSSMPVRDLDGWLPTTQRAIRIEANRGANGIDGVMSAALGAAAVARGPVVLVLGDLSFLHDLGALVTARIADVPLTVVVINNDGGGIFSFLPQAATIAPGVGLPDRYEQLFGTPHGIALGPIVEGLGHRHRLVDERSLAAALGDAIRQSGLTVLELRTDRPRNVELHRQAAAAAAAAIARSSGGGPEAAGAPGVSS